MQAPAQLALDIVPDQYESNPTPCVFIEVVLLVQKAFSSDEYNLNLEDISTIPSGHGLSSFPKFFWSRTYSSFLSRIKCYVVHCD